MDEYEHADEASATSPRSLDESYNADEWEEPSPEKPPALLLTTTCREESTSSHVIAENTNAAAQNVSEPEPEPPRLPGGDGAVQIAEKPDTGPSTSIDDDDRAEANAALSEARLEEEIEDPEYPPEMIRRFCQHPSLASKRSTETSTDAATKLASARVKAYRQLQAQQKAEAKAANDAHKQAKHAWRLTYDIPRSRQEYLAESTRRRKQLLEAHAATPTPRWYRCGRKTTPRVSTDDAIAEKQALAQRAQVASRRKAAARRDHVAATLAKVAATAASARHKSCGMAGSASACVEVAAVMTRLLDAVDVAPTHPVPSTMQVEPAPTSDTEFQPPSIEKGSEPQASTSLTTEWTTESEPEPDPTTVKDICDAVMAGVKTDNVRAPDAVAGSLKNV
ncbi:hypothetical protein SPRG_02322 [Saprolegnia parasitica CBS 223.65]|uniref:Uncharacterized protein n=1 Tax=Saprolegnia parasitica (strain CBS 223.65) TaxID=695850 RepID=A0A067D1J1_SAPPC|nr:hypothetical protein SPRG_02322 [Saprolegnia parasitica CBS 223.65]KDO32621.1 hypothetical protein SPRG_02322 [Saprolegnia parasitica CBS 223.65]|eukprot:XP_012196289.1 hypothetical protein SPRG_02322 [Saprolegnia parasitica CBS 223.65]